MRTCVFAMLKTVRLEGGLYESSLKSELIELSYWGSLFYSRSKEHNFGDREHNFQKVA